MLYLLTVKPASAGSRRIQEAIDLMRHNRHFLYSPIMAPVRILFSYITNEDEVCANYVEGEVKKLLDQRNTAETRAFCCILMSLFKCMDLGRIKDKYSLSLFPSAAILQNELSPWLPFPPERKAELEAFYGAPGMTGHIHRRDKWEIIFSDIRAKAEERKNRLGGRIIYFFDGLRLKAIIGEKRLADGSWDKGQLYTKSEFIALKYELLCLHSE